MFVLNLLKLRVWEVNIHFAAQDNVEGVKKLFLLVNALVWLKCPDFERLNQVFLVFFVEIFELLEEFEVFEAGEHLRFIFQFLITFVVKLLPLMMLLVVDIDRQGFTLHNLRQVLHLRSSCST